MQTQVDEVVSEFDKGQGSRSRIGIELFEASAVRWTGSRDKTCDTEESLPQDLRFDRC